MAKWETPTPSVTFSFLVTDAIMDGFTTLSAVYGGRRSSHYFASWSPAVSLVLFYFTLFRCSSYVWYAVSAKPISRAFLSCSCPVSTVPSLQKCHLPVERATAHAPVVASPCDASEYSISPNVPTDITPHSRPLSCAARLVHRSFRHLRRHAVTLVYCHLRHHCYLLRSWRQILGCRILHRYRMRRSKTLRRCPISGRRWLVQQFMSHGWYALRARQMHSRMSLASQPPLY